jgi:uncharacterized protein (DUF885 family)
MPWPIRFGPPPRITTLLRSEGAASQAGALPNGAAWYAQKVHTNTTHSLTPVQAEAMYNPTLRATSERGTMEVKLR